MLPPDIQMPTHAMLTPLQAAVLVVLCACAEIVITVTCIRCLRRRP